MRLTTAEHQVLQARWKHDAQALDAVRAELADTRAELARERTRRELAEADALRSGVRSDTLEQVLAHLRPEDIAPVPAAQRAG